MRPAVTPGWGMTMYKSWLSELGSGRVPPLKLLWSTVWTWVALNGVVGVVLVTLNEPTREPGPMLLRYCDRALKYGLASMASTASCMLARSVGPDPDCQPGPQKTRA